MRNLAHEAGYRALDELKEGRETVVVLMPKNWGCVAFDMGVPPEGIHMRFSNRHSGLKSLPIETLIIVGKGHDRQGVELARERLRGQLNPRIVLIDQRLTFDGNACFTELALMNVNCDEDV